MEGTVLEWIKCISLRFIIVVVWFESIFILRMHPYTVVLRGFAGVILTRIHKFLPTK